MKRNVLILAALTPLLSFAASVPTVYSTSGPLRTRTIPLEKLRGGGSFSLLFSIPELGAMGPQSWVTVQLLQKGAVVMEKRLHQGDADLYAPFHVTSGGVELRLASHDSNGSYSLQINRMPVADALKQGPNHSWQQASAMTLGRTVFASSDEAEYLPVAGTPRQEEIASPAGEDWYRFSFDSTQPKLVFFQVELMDRDDLPVDVSVFRVRDGKAQEYTRGQDTVSSPHEVQALPGNKFTTRVLSEPGDYYVRVRANHPEYKLRTRLNDVPPYTDPRKAVQTAVDYIMGAGDSWFANTPRRGGTFDRIMPVHQETSLCVGCHTSHFSQRAQVYAAANGYPVHQREQLQFLEERFYNNPRPFYGFEDQNAVWARVISAPANVLSRMSLITSVYEAQVSRRPMPEYHERIANYIKLYFAGRDKLPADETNGNLPLVSGFEVAWYSWKTTADPRMVEMIRTGEVKNMIDLCYQTQALADIDAKKYREQIDANAKQILEMQRPDGQWSMRFDPKEPEVEFQTGHALWALSAAGVPADHPQVVKAIAYLLKRQQEFGGWMDPLQSFENFKTPFRETQFAVLSLSSYFPQTGRAPGWGSPAITSLASDPVQLLEQLDGIWDQPPAGVIREMEALSGSNDVLIRQAATQALGRLSLPSTVPVLVKLLGDPSKLVQRTAAWSLREIYGAHPDTGDRELLSALASPNPRVRWGAGRVFAHHFSTLARRNDLVNALASLTHDPVVTVRMEAVRALWQAWFWNADVEERDRIENTVLAALKTEQHPWIEENLMAAVYNLADENIRYLYNNWVTLLGRPEDRTRAIQGRLAVESRLATKFAAVLNSGPDLQKKRLLTALCELPLRRGDIYDPSADLGKTAPPLYNRIGNDIEQIAFFGPSADQLARALTPLLDSSDSEMRALARRASLLVRETPYTAVEAAAGGRSGAVQELGARLKAEPDSGEIATAFYNKPAARAAAVAAVKPHPAMKLDKATFVAVVQPILEKKGNDGYACVNCHATHTRFNGTWSTVANVVDLEQPENSLLLRKPISTAEAEGVANAKATAHGGGQRWLKGSPEYNAILSWIMGAKTEQ